MEVHYTNIALFDRGVVIIGSTAKINTWRNTKSLVVYFLIYKTFLTTIQNRKSFFHHLTIINEGFSHAPSANTCIKHKLINTFNKLTNLT